MSKKIIGMIAWVLAVIGALNWGLVGLFNFDLVATVLGAGSMLSKAVYILVGLSAVILIALKLMNMKSMSMKK
jgi:uncharacterized membrane protein YuzA (DUF378 family)